MVKKFVVEEFVLSTTVNDNIHVCYNLSRSLILMLPIEVWFRKRLFVAERAFLRQPGFFGFFSFRATCAGIIATIAAATNLLQILTIVDS